MTRHLCTLIGFIASWGAEYRRHTTLRAQRHRAHTQALSADLCREWCWQGPDRPHCDCE